MDIDSVLQTFFAEADELLISMETALLRMDDGEKDIETINEIFRAAHTIKGSAGMFGLNEIVAFTHMVENVLDTARDGELIITDDLLSVLLSCRDHIAQLVNNAKQSQASDTTCVAQGEALLGSLKAWVPTATTATTFFRSPTTITPTRLQKSALVHNLWYISVRFGADLLRNGMDPLSIIRFLSSLGKITQITTITDNFPELKEFNAETLYLGFEIGLQSDANLEDIENAFMFVRDESSIKIIPPRSNVLAYIDLIKSLPENTYRLGEILIKTNIISYDDLELALDTQKQQAKDHQPISLLGSILIDTQEVAPELITAALDKQQINPDARALPSDARSAQPETRFIRVDAERLDILINLIGELVVNQQRVDLLSSKLNSNQLVEAVGSMGNFTEQIRDAALTLRMVAIGDTFLRFKRVVRDTAKELGKEIELEIEGAETELDRSMVEKLNDPLMHLVRNAMDHGIEAVAIRQARNKSETGVISLRASHESGSIVIEIIDDGGGLNLDSIRNKAIANGVIDANAQLSKQELCMLIFHPGLSTAETITNLSGRGVGMDVVRRNIEALRGAIEIETELGVGTCITIRLPLTLAIIDGFHVAAGSIDFIVPQNAILECVDLSTFNFTKEQHHINLRGEQVPYIRLQELFALEKQEDMREQLVVVQFGEKRAGIVVDSLFGEMQTVVKPMGPIFQALKGIGGSSLLGTGAVALILDIPQLINFAMNREHAQNLSLSAKMLEQK
jgi:two-component system, chemotaxis family, sensor kinase CheA